MGFIPINTRQQRASLPFRPGQGHCLQVKMASLSAMEDITMTIYILFRVLTFAKPNCDNVLQPSPLRGSGCNTLSHSGLVNVNQC